MGDSFAIILGVFVSILSIAWVTILPAIGLLYVMGWMK